MDTRISVVVLTHNRVREVTATVERLLALPERPAVIVVDNGSSDGTLQALRSRFAHLVRVRIIGCGKNLGAAGRNHGVAAAHAAGAITIMVPDILPPTEETRTRCAAVLPDLEAVLVYLRERRMLPSN